MSFYYCPSCREITDDPSIETSADGQEFEGFICRSCDGYVSRVRTTADRATWSDMMAEAYSAGLEDGRGGRTESPEGFDFPACYLEGYRHGREGRVNA